MPLIVAPIGRALRVIRILSDEKIKKHLENLGITIDSEISVVSESGGSIILLVKEGRLALDRDMATKILVTEAETKTGGTVDGEEAQRFFGRGGGRHTYRRGRR